MTTLPIVYNDIIGMKSLFPATNTIFRLQSPIGSPPPPPTYLLHPPPPPPTSLPTYLLALHPNASLSPALSPRLGVMAAGDERRTQKSLSQEDWCSILNLS